jgi:hypothetical protein
LLRGRNGTIRLLGNAAVKKQKSALSYQTNLPRMMPRRWSAIGLQAASIKAKPKLRVANTFSRKPAEANNALAPASGRRMRCTAAGGVRAASDESEPRPRKAPGYDRDGRKTGLTLQEGAHNPRSRRSVQFCGEFQTQYPLQRVLRTLAATRVPCRNQNPRTRSLQKQYRNPPRHA